MKKLLFIAAIASLGCPGYATAQIYPSRPITLVVSYAPGGANDIIARNVAEQMKASLGQPVIVENITGAGGSIGVGRVARAAPDGYTLSLGQNGGHVMNGAMYQLRYDLLSDFEPIALLSIGPMLIMVKNSMPIGDLGGLIVWLKANPEKSSMGHSGHGTVSHTADILFRRETGARFGLVPYRGGSLTLQDLVSEQIDMAILDTATSLTQVRAGRVRALAVTAGVRLSVAPDIPTVDEAGMPGFRASLWHGLWAPKATPRGIIAKLNSAVMDALADPGVRARLADLGQEVFPRSQQTPDSLASFQKAEIEKWWPIITEAGIKAE
jgi:tripartite-type tricarboxylate transporter receptor subunit TctC